VLLGTLLRRLGNFYASLETHAQQFRALSEVSQAVTASLELQHVLDSVAREAATLSGSDGCGIFEYNPTRRTFEAVANYRLSDAFLAAIADTPMDPQAGAIGRAVETRRPVQIIDLDASVGYPLPCKRRSRCPSNSRVCSRPPGGSSPSTGSTSGQSRLPGTGSRRSPAPAFPSSRRRSWRAPRSRSPNRGPCTRPTGKARRS